MATADRRTAVLTTVFLAAATLWLPAQGGSGQGGSGQPKAPQAGLTFRVDSTYVEVDAVVTDSAGHFIRDLKPSDFEVREDSRPQRVDVFTLVDIPFVRADPPLNRALEPEPDVATNTKAFEGRVYLIVLDAFHVDVTRTSQVKKQARQFIEQSLGTNDLAAVVHIGNPSAGQEFTSSRALLSASVDRFTGQKLPSAVLNRVRDATFKAGEGPTKSLEAFSPVRDNDEAARASQASQALESVKTLCHYMSGIQGRRKALLLFSEGIDFDTNDTLGSYPGANADIRASAESRDAPAVLDAEHEMIGAAARANVSLYTIDPRGVAIGDDALISVTLAIPQPNNADPSAGSPDTRTREAAAEVARGQTTLRVFAEQTGGLAHTGSNDFDGAFSRIVNDNSSYYVLGYYTVADKRDGKFHDLSVKVNRPDAKVRARKGYYAPKAGAIVPQPDVLRDLLVSPMPMSGLPMRVLAQVAKGTAGKGRVYLTVELLGKDLPLAQKNGSFTNKVELSYAVFDLSAAAKASGRKTMDLSLTPESRQAVATGGLRLTTEFEIAPGRYQLRLAGRESLGGASGSVFKDLTIPDFSQAPLSMGDLLLTSSSASSWPTTNDSASLKDVLPGPSTAEREFELESTMAVVAEIYDNEVAKPHSVTVSAVVRTHDGTQVFTVKEDRDSKTLSAAGAYRFLTRVPLSDFVPGKYLLTVEATSSLGGKPVTKEIQFSLK